MKKLLLLSTLIFFLFTFSFAQDYGWQDISANIPGNPDLSDVFFVSDNEGWISNSSQAEIYHTTDGGETFEIQTTLTGLEAIYMIDENEGYCGGGSGFVYKTSNGGENWDFFGTMASILTDMDFATNVQGYACGNGGAVFSITPQGVENLNSGLASDLAGISAPSENIVWVCGGSNIVLYNGSAFTFQSGPLGTYNDIYFINDLEGWVVGNSGVIGGTNDGGNHWKALVPSNTPSLYGVHSPNGVDVWAVGIQGTILHSPNGDDFWWNSPQDQGNNTVWNIEGAGLTTNFLRGVHFTSPTNGYVVGNDKTLLKFGELLGAGEGIETWPFEIFPNPAKDKFKVQSATFKVEEATLEVFDLDGRKLLEKHIQVGTVEIEIDVSHLQSGVYSCRLSIENISVTKKLIIQK